MDSRLLNCFLLVYQHRSITAAANAANLTQPAISKSIQQLEELPGVQLFERHSGGVVPTRFGEVLARRARIIDRELHNAQAEIKAMKDGNIGSVSIGASPLATLAYIPDVVAALCRDHPNIKVIVRTDALDILVPKLLDGELDLICAPLDFPDHPDIVREHLADIDHGVVSRKGHPLASREIVTPQELLAYPWVGLAGADVFRSRRRGSYFFANGLDEPRVMVEMNSIDGVSALIKSTEFLATFSLPVIANLKDTGIVALPIKGTFWTFRLGVAYRRTALESPLVNIVIAHLKPLTQVEKMKSSRIKENRD